MIDYFTLAANTAKAHRDRVLAGRSPEWAPHIIVELPIGSQTYSRSEMDAFQTDHLTVTSIDTQDELKTYKPGEWIEARQIDEHGRVEQHWICSVKPDLQLVRGCHCGRLASFVKDHEDGSREYLCSHGHQLIIGKIELFQNRKSA